MMHRKTFDIFSDLHGKDSKTLICNISWEKIYKKKKKILASPWKFPYFRENQQSIVLGLKGSKGNLLVAHNQQFNCVSMWWTKMSHTHTPMLTSRQVWHLLDSVLALSLWRMGAECLIKTWGIFPFHNIGDKPSPGNALYRTGPCIFHHLLIVTRWPWPRRETMWGTFYQLN